VTIVAWSAAATGSAAFMNDEEKTEHEQEMEEAKQEVQQLEDDPPEKLEDWPDGKAKYETFGGKEGEHSYNEGPEANLGPDSVRHREDGSVEVAGEEVDDPDEYKGDPIPGGPTDPNAESNPDEQRLGSDEDKESAGDGESSGDDSSDDDDS
jgi:hypothetical protein